MTISLPSEAMEPFAALAIGVLFARCEEATDPNELYDACQRLWGAARAIDRLAGCLRPSNSSNPDCLHFVMAASNTVGQVSTYINSKIGVTPLFSKEPAWTW